jgi:hypothetical protein
VWRQRTEAQTVWTPRRGRRDTALEVALDAVLAVPEVRPGDARDTTMVCCAATAAMAVIGVLFFPGLYNCLHAVFQE